MFQDTIEAVCGAAVAKDKLLKKNPLGFFVSSVVAGMFIAFGGMVSTTMSALASSAGSTVVKLIGAILFASALSLVITAGCELFTGNNMTMTVGALNKKVQWADVIKLWVICWIGNFVGSWITVLLYHFSGAGSAEAIAAWYANTALTKIGYTPIQMLIRAILCNICVCLAVWCSIKLKNEVAKLIMALWCILIFMICGFEHSIANMSLIGVALMNPAGQTIPVAGYFCNLLFVTIGNVIGGAVFVALPYHIIAQEK